jgi:pantoate kinase
MFIDSAGGMPNIIKKMGEITTCCILTKKLTKKIKKSVACWLEVLEKHFSLHKIYYFIIKYLV